MFKTWPYSPSVASSVEEVFSVESEENISVLFISIQNNAVQSITAEIFVSIEANDYKVYSAELFPAGSAEGPDSSRVAVKIIVPSRGALKVRASSADVDFLFSGEEYLVDESAYFGGVHFIQTNEVLGSGPASVPGAMIVDKERSLLHLMTPDGYYVSASFQPSESLWDDVRVISIDSGSYFSIALKNDGTCFLSNSSFSGISSDAVDSWTECVAVSAMGSTASALRANGTAYCTNSSYQTEMEAWNSLVGISNGNNFVVGLRADGTCVATSSCPADVSLWGNVVSVLGNYNNTVVGLKSDGTCYAEGPNADEIITWTNVIAISGRPGGVFGLKSDGSFYCVGNRSDLLNTLSGIVFASMPFFTNAKKVMGISPDGTVVVGSDGIDYHQFPVEGEWSNAVYVSSGMRTSVGITSVGGALSLFATNASPTPTEVSGLSELSLLAPNPLPSL